ncbi:MAG: protein kinase domain-containing protein [Thermoplasmatota archaeon]
MEILLIEDDPADAALVAAALTTPSADTHLRSVGTLREGLDALEELPADAVLLDLSLPDNWGLDGLTRLLVASPASAVVVLTGRRDDATALEAVRRGAQDYLVKGETSDALLWRSLRYAVERRKSQLATPSAAAVEEARRYVSLLESERAMLDGMLARGARVAGPGAVRDGMVLGGRYRIVRPIGQGASSRVFVGVDTKGGRPVAVKVVRAGSSGTEAQEFAREARLAAALDHPNVIHMLDFGSEEGTPYLVMGLAEGGSVADLVAKGATPPARARAIMLDVLAGLAYLHEKGVLHQDLKPANVVLAEDGRAQLTDFGIALSSAGRGWNDAQGALGLKGISGTPAYVSPETLMGLPVDARSDIYSAGALLYHLLAGKPYLALEGLDAVGIRRAIRTARPASRIPGGPLARVALRALSKDPEKRFATAESMRAAVEAAADEPQPARAATRPRAKAALRAPPASPARRARPARPVRPIRRARSSHPVARSTARGRAPAPGRCKARRGPRRRR